MEIVTIEDELFTKLSIALRDAILVGQYWRQGRIQRVSATSGFLLVSDDTQQTKIAMKPTRSLEESQTMALRLLDKERERGSRVEINSDLKD